MQSSKLGRWVLNHQTTSHVVLPGGLSLLLMAMYFSGNTQLQNVVAPTIENVPLFSAREFGVLEMLQNILLLCIILYSVRCLLAARDAWVRLVVVLLVLISVFTFLEEIDYGAPFLEYITGDYGSLDQATWNRNWHNRTSETGVQNVSYLKFAAKIGLLAGFVLAPLLLSSVRVPLIRLLLPSRWMIATVALIVLLSALAHALDDAGYAVIGDRPGNLYKNVSEFREMNMYYLFLLYVLTLYERLVDRLSPLSGVDSNPA